MLGKVFLVDTRDGSVGTNDAVVALNNKHWPLVHHGRLDIGDIEPEVASNPHAKGFVLDSVRIPLDLGLEDVSARRAFARPAPLPVCPSGIRVSKSFS